MHFCTSYNEQWLFPLIIKRLVFAVVTKTVVWLVTECLLTAWCRVLLEQLTGLQLVKKFLAFHGTRRCITALRSVRQLSLSWASPIQSIYPHPTSWRSILILSTHLRLGLPSGLFPSRFPTKTLHTLLSSPIRATCPAHLILLDFITRIILGEECKSFSSSLWILLHSTVTSSLLGPNILLNTMFSNTLSFLSSSNVNDQVSHPYQMANIFSISNRHTNEQESRIIRVVNILYSWIRASWIKFYNCPTRCHLFSLLHFCRQLYMFRVLTPIIRSLYSCNYSFWHWSTAMNISSSVFYSLQSINTRSCNYSCMSSWWWVSTPETCRAAYRNVINRIQSHLVGQLLN